MRRLTGLLTVLALCAIPLTAHATTRNGAAVMKWKVLPIITTSVVPNYNSGYGPTGGAGSGATPAPGPLAAPNAGFVDFGTVFAGYNYLYKYAARVDVTTNDPSGFQVYGEGSTDFNGSSNTVPISSALFWLVASGGNSPTSAAQPFGATTGTPYNGNQNIAYGPSLPPSSAMVWSYPASGSASQGFDFQLRLPGGVAADTYSLYVVYTVVGN